MLQKIGFLPGFNKQLTPTGAEAQWIDGENVRFRYGTPEKIGGWQQLGDTSLTGAARALHHMVNKDGIKYSIIGTNRILYAYSGGVYYDIHPIKTDFGALTDKLASSSGSAVLTITLSSTSGMTAGDILFLENVTPPTGSGYSASDFDEKTFMITEVVDATSVTITMGSTASATATDGDCSVKWYYPVGPADQVGVYGWGISQFGGTVSGPQTNTLDGALGDNVYGTGGSGTSIVLDSVTGFPTSGTNYIQVGTEEISYTGVSGSTTLTGITRAVRGTTRAAHSDGATVTNTSDYSAWNQAATTTDKVAEPGLWSLDNLGSTALALIVNGAVFEWDSDATNATATRATIVSGAPTASRDMLVSTPDRHLVLLGTETTIGTTTTQDNMFIRFSDQEDITTWTPTATNSAGTQRLAAGSRIMGAKLGKSAIYVWTDTSLFTMRFVGAPFTFAYDQVGSNCGLIGKNAAIDVDGTAYWMSENGFFRFTGKLESLDCLVEDYVYDDFNSTSNQLIYCGLNNLFGEVMWFYANSGSNVNNRCVVYNYIDSTPKRQIWYTNASSIFPRTTWIDSAIFGLPHATHYDADTDTCNTVGNTDGITTYYEHEKGVNQIKGSTTTAIPANILSGDFDITQKVVRGAATNLADLRGDGENIMRVSRFLPDFLTQTGNTIVELDLRNYPNETAASSSLGPFTITSSTTFQSCRARGRSVAVKVSNTAVDSNWKMGTFRLDIHAGGRR
tara:strand:+ start:7448 stop:9649 length:2202 start_codon:yes stop_codon:yes gene_type:complete